VLDGLRQAILGGDGEKAESLTETAIGSGQSAEAIMGALTGTMEIVGREYEEGERFVPEMLVSAVAMKRALEVLRPRLIDAGVRARGMVVIGTVAGDLHDIGKNLVCMMLEGAGLEVIDLGVDVAAQDFVSAVRVHRPQVLAMSALLTTTMEEMPAVIAALEEAGLRDGVKILVGGAPVTQEYADRIGADGYCVDAPAAAALARTLVEEESR